MFEVKLAGRIARAVRTVDEVIKRKAPLVPETAEQLKRVLGISARLLASAESNYCQMLARREDAQRREAQQEWLKGLPTEAAVKYGGLTGENDRIFRLHELLDLFGVTSSKALSSICEKRCLAFRRCLEHEVDHYALMAWLQLGELQAQRIVCAPLKERRFLQAFREIRKLCVATPSDAAPVMQQLCAESGMALVFVPEISGVCAWVVTQWVSAEKVILQLSLRGKGVDQL